MSAFSDQVLLSPHFDEIAYLQYILHTGGYQNQEEVDRLQRCINTVHEQMAALLQDHREDVLLHAQVVYKAQNEVESLRQTAQSLERVKERLRFMIQDPYETIQTHLIELENTNRAAEILSHVSKFLTLMKKITEETPVTNAMKSATATEEPCSTIIGSSSSSSRNKNNKNNSNSTTTTTASSPSTSPPSPPTVILLQQARTIRELDILLRSVSTDIRGIHVVEAHIPVYEKAASQLRQTVSQLLQMTALYSPCMEEEPLSSATITPEGKTPSDLPISSTPPSPHAASAVVADVGLALMCAHVLDRLTPTTVEFMTERRRSALRCITRELQPSAILEVYAQRMRKRSAAGAAAGGPASSFPSSALSTFTVGDAFLHQLHRTMRFVSQQTNGILLYWRVLLSKMDPITGEPYLSTMMRETPASSSSSFSSSPSTQTTAKKSITTTAVDQEGDPAQLVAEYLVAVLDKFREMVHHVQSHQDWGGETISWSLVYSRYVDLLHQCLVGGSHHHSSLPVYSREGSSAGAGTGLAVHRGCGLADIVDLLHRLDEEVLAVRHSGSRTTTVVGHRDVVQPRFLPPESSSGAAAALAVLSTATISPMPTSMREQFFRGWMMDMTGWIRARLLQRAFTGQRELLKPVLARLHGILESAQANPKATASLGGVVAGSSSLLPPNSQHGPFSSRGVSFTTTTPAASPPPTIMVDCDMSVYMRKVTEFLVSGGIDAGRSGAPKPGTHVSGAGGSVDPYGCSLRLFSVLDALQMWWQSVESARRRFPLPPQPSVTGSLTRDQLVHVCIANACTAVIEGLGELMKDAVDPAVALCGSGLPPSAVASAHIHTSTSPTHNGGNGAGEGNNDAMHTTPTETAVAEAVSLLTSASSSYSSSGGDRSDINKKDEGDNRPSPSGQSQQQRQQQWAIAGAGDIRAAANVLARMSEESQLRWQRVAVEQLRETFQRLHDASSLPFLLSALRLVLEWIPHCAATDMRRAMQSSSSADATPATITTTTTTNSLSPPPVTISSLYPQLQRVLENFRSQFYIAFSVRNATWVAASRQLLDVLLSRTIAHALLHPPAEHQQGALTSSCQLHASRVGMQEFLRSMGAILPAIVDHLRYSGVPRSTILLQGVLKQLELLYSSLAVDHVLLSIVRTDTNTATTTTTSSNNNNNNNIAQSLLSLMQRLPPLLARLFLLQQFIWEMELQQQQQQGEVVGGAETALQQQKKEEEKKEAKEKETERSTAYHSSRWPLCLLSPPSMTTMPSAAASSSAAPPTSSCTDSIEALEEALQGELFRVTQGGNHMDRRISSRSEGMQIPLLDGVSAQGSSGLTPSSSSPPAFPNQHVASHEKVPNTTHLTRDGTETFFSPTALALHHAMGRAVSVVGGVLPAEALFRAIWKDL